MLRGQSGSRGKDTNAPLPSRTTECTCSSRHIYMMRLRQMLGDSVLEHAALSQRQLYTSIKLSRAQTKGSACSCTINRACWAPPPTPV